MRKCSSAALAVVFLLVLWSSLSIAEARDRAESQNTATDISHLWSGLSLGIGLGASSTESKFAMEGERGVLDNNGVTILTISSDALSSDGRSWDVFGTIQVGYDWLFNDRFLVGAFADFDFGANSGANAFRHDGNPVVVGRANTFGAQMTLDGRLEAKNAWSIGGRLGVLVHPRILMYGLAGYTQLWVDGQFNGRYIDNFNPQTLPSVSYSKRLDGYILGGGTEIALRDNLSFKLEYRYSQYDGKSVGASREYNCCAVAGNRDTLDVTIDDVEQHSIRGTLTFSLGNPL